MARTTPSTVVKRILDAWGYYSFHCETYTKREQAGGGTFHHRRDLGGFADKLAWRKEPGVSSNIVAIQVCAMSGYASHLKKIQGSPRAKSWLGGGGMIEIWAVANAKSVDAQVKLVRLRLRNGEIEEEEGFTFTAREAIGEARRDQRRQHQPRPS